MREMFVSSQRLCREIPIFKLELDPDRPRRTLDENAIERLGQSIREVGLLHPITVRPIYDKFRIISGERRYLAAHLAGLYTLPCFVMELNDEDAMIIALSENGQHEDMHFFYKADAMSKIIRNTGISDIELSMRLGTSPDGVAKKLELLKIPPFVRRYIIENRLKERHARALLRLNDPIEMLKAAQAASKEKMNVPQLELYIDSMLSREEEKKKKPTVKGFCRDIRLYVNTIGRTVEVMRNSGFGTSLEKSENDNSIVYKITIEKR